MEKINSLIILTICFKIVTCSFEIDCVPKDLTEQIIEMNITANNELFYKFTTQETVFTKTKLIENVLEITFGHLIFPDVADDDTIMFSCSMLTVKRLKYIQNFLKVGTTVNATYVPEYVSASLELDPQTFDFKTKTIFVKCLVFSNVFANLKMVNTAIMRDDSLFCNIDDRLFATFKNIPGIDNIAMTSEENQNTHGLRIDKPRKSTQGNFKCTVIYKNITSGQNITRTASSILKYNSSTSINLSLVLLLIRLLWCLHG